MKIFFTLMDEMQVLDTDGYVYIEESVLPNGVAVLLLNPKNFNALVQMAAEKSRQIQRHVELVAIDLQEVYGSNFVSHSAVEGMPDWVSVN